MSIWNYREVKKGLLGVQKLITLGEGDTQLQLVRDNNNQIFLKREDQNPTGSWKDRGYAYKLTKLVSEGVNEVVIPSSGNAAISLLTYAQQVPDLKVHVIVSPNISEVKKESLYKLTAHSSKFFLHFDTKAKRLSASIASKTGAKVLRSAIDSDILTGYWTLGFEIFKQLKHKIGSDYYLIAPASSGTALVGFVQGLQLKLDDDSKLPKIIVVQTQSCHPIVSQKYKNDVPIMQKSLADAIVDQSSLRSPQILKIISQTDGDAFNITNKELEVAKVFMNDMNFRELSYTSLLSIAGYLRLRAKKQDIKAICIASGR